MFWDWAFQKIKMEKSKKSPLLFQQMRLLRIG